MTDTEKSFRIKVGLTIDSDNLNSFSKEVLNQTELNISRVIEHLSCYSDNPEKLFEIVNKLETFKLQIQDVAVANHEYQLYISSPQQQPQQEVVSNDKESND